MSSCLGSSLVIMMTNCEQTGSQLVAHQQPFKALMILFCVVWFSCSFSRDSYHHF
ncbi:hypothetical protein HanRHA438_Chr08g0334631 [Helianthus annuus]|nr:hypothetical protein HanRHA438_Chr08g0334631 [Helianthus annuus]